LDYFENFLIIWTDYLKYRAQLRNFDLESIETILHIPRNDTLTIKHVEWLWLVNTANVWF